MQFEKWYPIDILKPPTHAYDLGMILYTGDGDSVIVGAVVTRDGDPVTLAGTVQGYVILPDGSTPPAFSGTIDGNRVSVTLPETAMVLSGRITLAIRVINGDEKTVVLGATAMVRRTSSESAYDPDAVIPTWDQVLVKIGQMDDAAKACNEAARAAQAVVSSSVRYDTAQTLSATQQAQARENIGAQERIEPDCAIALDLTDSVAAYPTGNVGQQIGYNISSATTTYKHAAWVQKGCEYALTIVNGETLAADTNRASMVIDTDGTILQTMSTAVLPSTTVTERFTAVADGFLVFSVDANAVSISLAGGVLATRETATPMSPEAYGAGAMGGNGDVTVNGKILTVRGNCVRMRGTIVGSGSSTYAIFSVAGTVGGVSGAINADRVKSLFTGGNYCTLPGTFLPGNYGAELRVSYNKASHRVTPQEWGWGLYLYTYDPTTDTLTGVYGETPASANSMGQLTIPLPGDKLAIMRANGNFALLLCGMTDAQRLGNMIDLRWSLVPVPGNGTGVPVSGSAPTITAATGASYTCGTLDSLIFTPCASGLCEVVFTAGNAMVLNLPSTVRMPDWWTGVEAGRTYDLMILNGTLAGVMSWAT